MVLIRIRKTVEIARAYNEERGLGEINVHRAFWKQVYQKKNE